jgi:hypothetical protein
VYCEAQYDGEFNEWYCGTANDTTMPPIGCR